MFWNSRKKSEAAGESYTVSTSKACSGLSTGCSIDEVRFLEEPLSDTGRLTIRDQSDEGCLSIIERV